MYARTTTILLVIATFMLMRETAADYCFTVAPNDCEDSQIAALCPSECQKMADFAAKHGKRDEGRISRKFPVLDKLKYMLNCKVSPGDKNVIMDLKHQLFL